MRICLVYDCLFPHTVGGAERWYRNLSLRLAGSGHEVTYLTLRQWDRGDEPDDLRGVRVQVVGPRMSLYSGGRRRILPPLVFGFGVLWHLLREGGRYDVVHTASFPYFSLLAAGALRAIHRYRLVVDWHEVWTRSYWQQYLGGSLGLVGWWVQRLCLALPQQAFCFSKLHARRLTALGLRGDVVRLPGEYEGPTERPVVLHPEQCVVFAGRHIPEKQVTAIPPAVALARQQLPELRGLIIGDGPERPRVLESVAALGLDRQIEVPGFLPAAQVEQALASALCLVLPSRREGYGMVVLEAASHGTPSIVVAGEDNAATELVDEGENGFIAPSDSAENLAEAICRIHNGGTELRARTAAWFARNITQLSLESSLQRVIDAYGSRDPERR